MNVRKRFLSVLSMLAAIVLGFPHSTYGDGSGLFRPTPGEESGYTETWTFSLDFAGGGFAQISMGITNLGPGSGRSICRIFVAHPDADWRSQEVVSPGEWVYDEGDSPGLRIGGCSLAEQNPLTLVAAGEEGDLQLILQGELAPETPPGTPWKSSGDEFHTRMFAAGVSGAVRIRPAGGTPEVEAAEAVTVSVEHNRSTLPPDKFGRQWFRFRTLDDGPYRSGLVRSDGDADLGRGWIANKDGSPQEMSAVTISAEGDPGSQRITFGMGRARERTVTLRPVSPPVHFAPLREMGFFGRVMAAIVGDPLITVVDVEWAEGDGMRRGRLEISTFR